MKAFMFVALSFVGLSCGEEQSETKQKSDSTLSRESFKIYSKNVTDSFSIFVNLPPEYNSNPKQNFPVVYLLDANLYFEIIATILNKYAEVGLAPVVILVGIGYQDFPTMDSLRNRDDTYPAALPEYEMNVSGGADKFLSFIEKELIPVVDSQYRIDTSKTTLMGHSLGGYFTAFALLQHLMGKSGGINNFIAASPSLHYNHYYVLECLRESPPAKKSNLKGYFTFGGLEQNENDPSLHNQDTISKQLNDILLNRVTFKTETYSNLGHMDTQIPTFIKGLQFTLQTDR